MKWTIGDVIRKQREDRGWTQLSLAKMARVNLNTISRVEAGHTFKIETLERIAFALGYESVADLYRLVPGGEQ